MLNITPWNKLPLVINWITDNYKEYLQNCPSPPAHMSSLIQPLSEFKLNNDTEEDYDSDEFDGFDITDTSCHLCKSKLLNFDEVIYCTNRDCNSSYHTTCLAMNLIKSKDIIIPIEGKCPECELTIVWKEAINKKKKIESRLYSFENWIT